MSGLDVLVAAFVKKIPATAAAKAENAQAAAEAAAQAAGERAFRVSIDGTALVFESPTEEQEG